MVTFSNVPSDLLVERQVNVAGEGLRMTQTKTRC